MEIRARQHGNIVILGLSGCIDVDSANLIETVGQCVRDGYCDIVCNFEDAEKIDYMGISALVLAYKEVVNNKGRMKFANIPLHMRNMFSLTGIDKVIDIYPSESEALRSFSEDKIIEKIKKMQLRRRFKRLPIDLKVEINNKYDKDSSSAKVDILNLSGIGAFVYGASGFKLGDELIMKMKLPPKDEEMVLEAKVVWLADRQIQLHLNPGMGVEFHRIPAQTQEKLLEFIERNLSFMSSDG